MATKPKAKAKPRAKKATRRKTSPFVLSDRRFAPGTTVGVYPAHTVTAEQMRLIAPIPNPTEVAKVADDGTVKVHGLKPGAWVAAAEQDGTWRYLSLMVN